MVECSRKRGLMGKLLQAITSELKQGKQTMARQESARASPFPAPLSIIMQDVADEPIVGDIVNGPQDRITRIVCVVPARG